MKWVKCSERLPEIDKTVLVTDGESDWIAISGRYDVNESKRSAARTRKDKYPELIRWSTGCCCSQFFESEIKYWIPLPDLPEKPE